MKIKLVSIKPVLKIWFKTWKWKIFIPKIHKVLIMDDCMKKPLHYSYSLCIPLIFYMFWIDDIYTKPFRYKKGDIIRNEKPYENESSYQIINIGKNYYECATLPGKHCLKADFNNRFLIDFEQAEHYQLVKA